MRAFLLVLALLSGVARAADLPATITYPTATTWDALVSDLPPGLHVLEVEQSDGTIVEVTVVVPTGYTVVKNAKLRNATVKSR